MSIIDRPCLQGDAFGGREARDARDARDREERQPPALRAHIRWMIRRDLPEVLAIENASFPDPWSEEEFLSALRQRNIIGMVAEGPAGLETLVNGERRTCPVLGLVIYELCKSHISVMNFAVHPDFRFQGVGRQLIAAVARKLSSHRRHRMELYVRESNLGAQLFYKREGFKAEGVKRGYYWDTEEDAYVMTLSVKDGDS